MEEPGDAFSASEPVCSDNLFEFKTLLVVDFESSTCLALKQLDFFFGYVQHLQVPFC